MTDRKQLIKQILIIALPMIVSQGADTLILFTDRFFMAQVGPEHLSATLSGGITAFVVTCFPMGIAIQSTALIAQHFGSSQKKRCAEIALQTLYCVIALYPIILGLAYFLGPKVMQSMGHSDLHTELEIKYFNILIFAMLFPLAKTAFASFFTGIGKTNHVMIGNVLSVFVNIPLSYILIFGKFGFEARGIEGAAIATVIAQFCSCLYFIIVYFSAKYNELYDTRHRFAIHLQDIKKIFYFGTPAGVEFFLQVAAFDFFILVFQSQGNDIATAISITFNWDLLAFLPMVGINAATMSLVGQSIGKKNIEEAKLFTKYSLLLASLYALFFVVIFLTCTNPMIDMFLSAEQANDTVRNYATDFLQIASIYLIADAVFLVYSGALKGAGDNYFSMIITIGVYWTKALGTWYFVKYTDLSPQWIWSYFVFCIVMIGTLFYLRYRTGKWQNIKMINDETAQ